MTFLGLLTNYIIPIIYDSMVSLILVLFFLFIFRIKDSNIRILFFFLPLIKPFLVVIEKVDVHKPYFQSRIGTFGFRLPDPTNIINIVERWERGPVILFSDLNYLILFLIIVGIFLVLVIRWVNLALFYKKLAYEEKVGREDIPEIYNIIDSYAEKIKVRSPDVSLTHKNYFSPFMVGIKNCTLVLSPGLMDKLTIDEKETLIQHELSHIKRNDNLIGWIALILRDLNFFNPFAYITYLLIKSEQEKDSDKLVVKYTKKHPKEIAKNILNSIMKIKSTSLSTTNTAPAQSSSFSPVIKINQKRLENRINCIIKTDPAKIYSHIFPKILMYILFILLLLIQIMFIIKIDNLFIFLR